MPSPKADGPARLRAGRPTPPGRGSKKRSRPGNGRVLPKVVPLDEPLRAFHEESWQAKKQNPEFVAGLRTQAQEIVDTQLPSMSVERVFDILATSQAVWQIAKNGKLAHFVDAISPAQLERLRALDRGDFSFWYFVARENPDELLQTFRSMSDVEFFDAVDVRHGIPHHRYTAMTASMNLFDRLKLRSAFGHQREAVEMYLAQHTPQQLRRLLRKHRSITETLDFFHEFEVSVNRFPKDLPPRARHYGALDHPSFVSSPQYGPTQFRSVMAGVDLMAKGEIRSVEQLWKHHRVWRSTLATRLADANSSDFTQEFRNLDNGSLITPLAGKYADYLGERLNLSAGNLSTEPVVATLGGRSVELTGVRYVPSLSGGGWHIQHGVPALQPEIFQHIDQTISEMFSQKTADPETYIRKAMEVHWWLVQATPDYRGSAAIADSVLRSLLEAANIQAPRWKKGIVPDLEAQFSDKDRYVDDWRRWFARPPGTSRFKNPGLSWETRPGAAANKYLQP